MDILDQLTKKVHLAADELVSIKKERLQLLSEIEILRANNLKAQGLLRENDTLKKDHERLRAKFLKMQKKIDQILALHSTTPDQPQEVSHENVAQ